MSDQAARRRSLAQALAEAGCVAPEEEADELLEAAGGDDGVLRAMVGRRVMGQPLAWATGSTIFAGARVHVSPGVYVPRWQTQPMARRAAQLLPANGCAVDLCTGSGAIALALMRARPGAHVVATDLSPLACRCAAANGAEVYEGHLAEPLPATMTGQVDVVVGVVPYVPTGEMIFLPRDVREHEPVLALDGGEDGTRVLVEAVVAAARLLKPGGSLLLELGGDQDVLLRPVLVANGFVDVNRYVDDEGDLRAIEAVRSP